MAKSVNKVILVGRLGKDPDVRTLPNGKVATFTLATTRYWTERGERREEVEWHRVAVWNPLRGPMLADFVERSVRKGDQVYLEGRIHYNKMRKQGVETWSTDIIVKDLLLLGNKKGQPDDVDEEDPGYPDDEG